MAILVNKDSRVVVQGITGGAGSFHAKQCMEYGTQIVAGVTPGRGGEKFEGKVPVFDTVAEAVEKTRANVSLIFVPPPAFIVALVVATGSHRQDTKWRRLAWVFGLLSLVSVALFVWILNGLSHTFDGD